MNKKEFLDTLAGKPWVRLREIADKMDVIYNDESEKYAKEYYVLQNEAEQIMLRHYDYNYAVSPLFSHVVRNAADTLQQEAK